MDTLIRMRFPTGPGSRFARPIKPPTASVEATPTGTSSRRDLAATSSRPASGRSATSSVTCWALSTCTTSGSSGIQSSRRESATGDSWEAVGGTDTSDLRFLERPNPFWKRTSLSFRTDSPRHVLARIYDASGRIVRTLVDEPLSTGRHDVSWDGRPADRSRAPGIYFARLRADGSPLTRKLVLLEQGVGSRGGASTLSDRGYTRPSSGR